MKTKKITKPTLEGDTYLVAQAVNHNAEVLESALNRIKELEKRLAKEKMDGKPIEIEDASENKECRGCHYNDGEPHAECVLCNKDVAKEESTIDEVIAEIDKQEEWLAQAGYDAYNVCIAFGSIKRALRKMC